MKKNGGSLDVQSFCVCYSSQFSLLLMMRFPPLHTPPFNHTHSTTHKSLTSSHHPLSRQFSRAFQPLPLTLFLTPFPAYPFQ